MSNSNDIRFIGDNNLRIDVLTTESEGTTVRAKDFALRASDWKADFLKIGRNVAEVRLFDTVEGGNTFQAMDEVELLDVSDDTFAPSVGVSCSLNYDEVCALAEGFAKLKKRMELAQAAHSSRVAALKGNS